MNPYIVLGVDRAADQETIRAAYRRLARRFHPDSGGNERYMILINAAWHVLGNPTRRAAYDSTDARPEPIRRAAGDGRTVVDFGRYAGWSLAEIAAKDDNYLIWLGRTQTGRPLRNEIAEILSERAGAIATLRPSGTTHRRSWARR